MVNGGGIRAASPVRRNLDVQRLQQHEGLIESDLDAGEVHGSRVEIVEGRAA
jgi:hypothetical protein